MRHSLITLTCLSTFALAQNVLAIAPAQETAADAMEISMTGPSVAQADFIPSPARGADEGAPMSAMALLMVGLSGLTIAGGRRHDRERSTA